MMHILHYGISLNVTIGVVTLKIKALGIFAALLLAGCGVDTVDLPEGRWQEVSASVGNTPVSLEISGDTLMADTGCNSLLGSVKMEGNKLTTEDIATTLMACSEEDTLREEQLLDLLKSQPVVAFDEEILTLKSDDLYFRFSQQPADVNED